MDKEDKFHLLLEGSYGGVPRELLAVMAQGGQGKSGSTHIQREEINSIRTELTQL